MNETCTRAIELLDDYVFAPPTLLETDTSFLLEHLASCENCKSAYAELAQWKTLADSAKYHASDELKKSILACIELEEKRQKRALVMRKRLMRISSVAASFVLVAVTAIVVLMMQKDASSDNMTLQESASIAGDVKSAVTESDEMQDEMQNGMGYADDFNEAGGAPEMKMFAAPYAESDEPHDDVAAPEEVPGLTAGVPEGAYNDIAAEPEAVAEAPVPAESVTGPEQEPAYKISVFTENSNFIDTVNRLDYVVILLNEDSVNSWIQKEQLLGRLSENPPLYDAIVHFKIDKDTLLWLDSQSTSKDYYLGEDAINALYDQDWEFLANNIVE